jgi:aminotransferase in exopolysaccharide biosynthesis
MPSISSLPARVVSAMRSVVGQAPVALHEPTFSGNEWVYLKECLDTTFVSSIGKFVDRFEADLSAFTGAKHAVAVVNGTAALHVALKLIGVQAGEEVLIPALTFVGTANAVAYCGAVPHFVDSEMSSLGVDVDKLKDYLRDRTEQRLGMCINPQTGRIIRAIVPMHTFGHPVDIGRLLKVAADYNIVVIEDAAESLGSYYHGQHTGTFGKLGSLSFNGNKTVTTGGGGALLTDDAELARHAKHLTTTAKVPHAWEFLHDEVGYNYRLPNLNAALGCAQLEQLPDFLKAKRQLFTAYQKAYSGVTGVELLNEPRYCRSNFWLNALMLSESSAGMRDEILEVTNQAGIMTRPVWTLMHQLQPYRDCPRMDLATAEAISGRLINIPSSSKLGKGFV